MKTEDLEKAAAEVINGGRRLTPEERDQMMYEALNRKDAEEERLRQDLMGKPIYLPKYDTPMTAELEKGTGSVISMLERTQIAMYETEGTLKEILQGLKPDLTDKADEMNVTGMLDAAENALRKANSCKWLAKEINELLYGQH